MNFHPYGIGAVDVSDNSFTLNSFRMSLVDGTWVITRYCMADMEDQHIMSFSQDVRVSDLVHAVTPTCPTATHLFIELVKSYYRNHLSTLT